MSALSNSTLLEYPLSLRQGLSATVLRTVGDAAKFIIDLPKEHDGRIHWAVTGALLEAVDRHPADADLLKTATLSMENALSTEKMLRD